MNIFNRYFNLFSLILLSLIQLMTYVDVNAQVQKFQKVYGGYSYDSGNDLIQTSDTGYMLLCTSNSFSSSSDIYLLKVDKYGAYVWQRTYGGSEIEGACKIKFTQDGNVVIAGHTSSFTNATYDFYLIKANMNGDTLWTKHYGTSEWDFANSMDTCSDGGFIMAGKTYDTGNAYSDILVVKTDADGNEQWRKTIGGNKDDVANSIITVSDGYIICGTTESIGAGGKDIYVVKVDLSGILIWEKTLGGTENDDGESVIFDSNNNNLIIGANTKSFGISQFYNFYLQKLSLNGNEIPVSFISTNNSNYYLKELILKPNGNIMLCGDVDMQNSTDFMLLEYDNYFNFVIGTTYGGSFKESPNSLISTSDNGICAIGLTTSVGNGLDNIFLVKCDTLVTNVGGLQSFVNLQNLYSEQNNIGVIFPNPSSGVFTYKLINAGRAEKFSDLTFELYNTLSQKVQIERPQLVKQSDEAYLNFNLSGLENGNYSIQIHHKGELIDSRIISILK